MPVRMLITKFMISNSDFAPSEFDQLPAFGISDPFHFSADLPSEVQTKRDMEDLNYVIDRMLGEWGRNIRSCEHRACHFFITRQTIA